MLSVCALTGMTQPKTAKQFKLIGTLPGRDGAWIYISYPDGTGKYMRDSARVSGNHFSLKGAIKEPVRADIFLKTEKPEPNNYLSLFIEPVVMTIALEPGAFDKAVVTGSATQADNQLLQRQMDKVNKRWKTITDTLTIIGRKDNFKFQEYKNWLLLPLFDEMREINVSFVMAHPDSYYSASVLQFYARELVVDSVKTLYNGLSARVRQSSMGKTIVADLEKRKKGVPGITAPVFTSTDINGKECSLTALKGKYVLLDFWGSWCQPCRKLNPHLKELYAQYAPKGFEVVGVAADDRAPDAWKKAVAQDGLPWLQVLQGDIGKQYNIMEYPTQVLIDPAGTIIARYGGADGEEHSALDKKLETVFK